MKQAPLPHVPAAAGQVQKKEAPTRVLARAVKELLVLNQRLAQLVPQNEEMVENNMESSISDWADDLYNEHGHQLEEIIRSGK